MLAGCQPDATAAQERPATAVVVARYPHDAGAFTQGLLFYHGHLYESTGLHGHSSLRRVALATGEILAQTDLEQRYFGEGLARVGNQLLQLTWKAGVAFVYDLPDGELARIMRYSGEGWGLTFDGRHLIMSDGSATLRFIDPATFATQHRLTVTHNGKRVSRLNELEYINGEIWANVWHADDIIRIEPASGRVTGIVSAAHLRAELPASAGALNGIAWDAVGKRLFITGKNWPTLYQIRLPE
ncbi:MAG TPA: glutaminyl-peptide cyclotransferase [Salinisphaeraceae bacterium]|nr:glutaminyl-peptide cyclotransferase [Salinisphaeraceae bacterium]